GHLEGATCVGDSATNTARRARCWIARGRVPSASDWSFPVGEERLLAAFAPDVRALSLRVGPSGVTPRLASGKQPFVARPGLLRDGGPAEVLAHALSTGRETGGWGK